MIKQVLKKSISVFLSAALTAALAVAPVSAEETNTAVESISTESSFSIRTISPAVQVDFTSEIDEDTIGAIAICKQNEATDLTTSRIVSADKKSVILSLPDLEEDDILTLTVPEDSVKDAAGSYVQTYTTTFVASPEKNSMYNLDFSELTAGSYTVAQLQEEGLPVRGVSYVLVDVTEAGVGNIHSTRNNYETPRDNLVFVMDPVVKGEVEFNMVFNNIDSAFGKQHDGIDARMRYPFVMSCLANQANNGIVALKHYIGEGILVRGRDEAYHRGDNTYNLKIKVFAQNETDPWTVEVYDNNSATGEILGTSVITREVAPDLSNVGVFITGKEDHVKIPMKSVTAEMKEIDRATVTESSASTGKIRTISPAVDLTFDKALDSETLSGVTVKNSDGTDMVRNRVLSEDGKDLKLVLNSLTEGESYIVNVDNTIVKDTAGVFADAYTVTAVADKAANEIFRLDFSDYAGQTLTATELNAKHSFVEPYLYTKVVVDENGVASIVFDDTQEYTSGNIVMQMNLPEEISSGCINFDFKHRSTYTTAGGSTIEENNYTYQIFRINGKPFLATGKWAEGVKSNIVGMNFVNGSDTYHKSEAVYDLRVELMADTDESDWTVNVYDKDVSLTIPILTTVLARANYPTIQYVNSKFWGTTSAGSSNFAELSLNQYYWSASYAEYTGPAISEYEVINTDTSEEITSNLGGAVNFDVNVNVTKAGGNFYAAVYEGNELVAVKMADVTAPGNYTLQFTNMTTSETTKLRGFYWTDNMQPMANPIDLLN